MRVLKWYEGIPGWQVGYWSLMVFAFIVAPLAQGALVFWLVRYVTQ